MKASEIAKLLPEVYRQTLNGEGVLDAILAVMESLHEPAESALSELDVAFDPRRTADRFVPYLAGWVDLARMFEARSGRHTSSPGARLLGSGLGRLRELIAEAAFLSQWRGTARGLLRFLQIATGEREFHVEENVVRNGERVPFHIRIVAPAGALRQRELVEWVIESEKPAYVTYELNFVEQEA